MKIQEIDMNTFNSFAENHTLKNFYQTKEYGELMNHSDFSSMYIGGFKNGILVAASLILYKNIATTMKYGYAPRGFLVDYYDYELVSEFTKGVKDFFFKRSFAFIKINPEVTYSQVDFENKSKVINPKSKELISFLKRTGYDKLKDNLYFESLLPKYTPVISLPDYDLNSLNSKLINDIQNYEISGLKIISGTYDDLEKLYSLINVSESKTLTYYQYLYNIFSKSDMVDLLMVKLDSNMYVKFLQKKYIYEHEINERINKEFNNDPKNVDLYNRKMKSDEVLSKIYSDITKANAKMDENNINKILGGALVIKYKGRITILTVGNSFEYDSIDVKSYIYFKIIEQYKKSGYLYLDMNGITGDFSDSNPYKDLNDFKLKFNPKTFEFIGEFDLVVNKPFHQILWTTNKIQKEFYKPAIKN